MSMDEVNDWLSGGGGRSASFPAIGASVTGYIIDAEIRAQTDFKTGAVLTWDDGNPRKQLVITLQTDLQEDDEDDGIRKLYAKGKMLAAIRNAAGQPGLQRGGKLRVKYVANGEARRGFNPPKLYEAQYRAPEAAPVEVPDDEPPPADYEAMPF